MKKVITKSVMLSLFVMMAVNGQAQTHWAYSYDATGNRTQRTITSGSTTRKKTAPIKDLFNDDDIRAQLNENHSKLMIETLGCNNVEITIYDLTGKEMIFRRSESEVTLIDIAQLRRGTYLLSVEINAEKRSCKFTK